MFRFDRGARRLGRREASGWEEKLNNGSFRERLLAAKACRKQMVEHIISVKARLESIHRAWIIACEARNKPVDDAAKPIVDPSENSWRLTWVATVALLGIVGIAMAVLIVWTWLEGTVWFRLVVSLIYISFLTASFKLILLPWVENSGRPTLTLRKLGRMASVAGLTVFILASAFTLLRSHPVVLQLFPYIVALLEILSAAAVGAGILYILVRGEPDRLARSYELLESDLRVSEEILSLCEAVLSEEGHGEPLPSQELSIDPSVPVNPAMSGEDGQSTEEPDRSNGVPEISGEHGAANGAAGGVAKTVAFILIALGFLQLGKPQIVLASDVEKPELKVFLDQSGSTAFEESLRILEQIGTNHDVLSSFSGISLHTFAEQGSSGRMPLARIAIPSKPESLVSLPPAPRKPGPETSILTEGRAAYERRLKQHKEDVERILAEALNLKANEWRRIVGSLKRESAQETCLAEVIFLSLLNAAAGTTTVIVTDGKEHCPGATSWRPEDLGPGAGRVFVVLVPWVPEGSRHRMEDPVAIFARAKVLRRKFQEIRVIPHYSLKSGTQLLKPGPSAENSNPDAAATGGRSIR